MQLEDSWAEEGGKATYNAVVNSCCSLLHICSSCCWCWWQQCMMLCWCADHMHVPLQTGVCMRNLPQGSTYTPLQIGICLCKLILACVNWKGWSAGHGQHGLFVLFVLHRTVWLTLKRLFDRASSAELALSACFFCVVGCAGSDLAAHLRLRQLQAAPDVRRHAS